MQIFFIRAAVPIIKRYEIVKKELVKHPYPFVYEVTSSECSCLSLKDMYAQIIKRAPKGECLIKGMLNKPLVSESRKGSTNSEDATKWVCLDLDGIDGYTNVDDFLKDIGCANTDYILQWSSSMGIEDKNRLRCHIFMELDTPCPPQRLKDWLMYLNLNIPTLKAQLELTKTGVALRWPLDITTCQNDKLIYIAPPKLGPGVSDPFRGKARISFEKRKLPTLTIQTSLILPDAIKEQQKTCINELRLKANLPKIRVLKYKFDGNTEYLSNPGRSTITGMKEERGFVYFNLNGGDSWGYYHPVETPDYIYNFKGEPVYKTEELLPEYWAKLTQQATSGSPNKQGNIYLAFREFTSGVYWNGVYNTTENTLELYPAKNETQLRHFMKNHRMPIGETIPDWRRVFDPLSTTVIDHANKIVNIYNPSEFYKRKTLPKVSAPPTVINRIIDHVLGNDPAILEHFYNWLAVIVQYRTRTGTAWVLHGTQGTGKGLLMHKILTPLFGYENVSSKRMEEMESQFTEFMENKFVVFIDEIESGKSLYHNKITARLKNLIVEPVISVRPMYRPPYMAVNYSNMIFASNKPSAVEIAPDDRRFNVGSYQNKSLVISEKEYEAIDKELLHFFAYLSQLQADRDKARIPLSTPSKATLINISMPAIDCISTAVREGDIQLLWDHLPSSKEISNGNIMTQMKAQAYKDLLINIINSGENKLTRDELFVIFDYTVGNMPTSPNKFSSLLKHHRIHLEPIWKEGRSIRGLKVEWKKDQEWVKQIKSEIDQGVI